MTFHKIRKLGRLAICFRLANWRQLFYFTRADSHVDWRMGTPFFFIEKGGSR